jgi:hypothetical protein
MVVVSKQVLEQLGQLGQNDSWGPIAKLVITPPTFYNQNTTRGP